MKKHLSKGMITVEACVSVTLFMLVMFIFLGIFMMFMAHGMVAHVTMQTAESLALDAWQIKKLQLNDGNASVGRLIANGILELSGQTEENNPGFVSESEWWNDGMALENAVNLRFLGYLTGGDDGRASKYVKAVKIHSPSSDWHDAFDFSESKVVNGDLYVTVKYKLDYMFQIWGLENGVDVTQTAVSHLWMDDADSANVTIDASAGTGFSADSLLPADAASWDYWEMQKAFNAASAVGKGDIMSGMWLTSGEYKGNYVKLSGGIEYFEGLRTDDHGNRELVVTVQGTDITWGDLHSNLNDPWLGRKEDEEDGIHDGYHDRAKTILDDLENQTGISQSDMIESAKRGEFSFNFSGHSMGGAVVQVLAILLIEKGVPESAIKGYTFNSAYPFSKDARFDYPDLQWFNVMNESDNVSRGTVTGAIENGARIGQDIIVPDDYSGDGINGNFPNGAHGLDYLREQIDKDKWRLGVYYD